MSQSAFQFEEIRDYSPENFLVSPCNQQAYEAITNYPWKSYALSIYGPKGSGKTYLAKILNTIDCVVLAEDVSLKTNEEDLFHKLNRVKETEGYILLTSEQPLTEIGFKLPDLVSRLSAIDSVKIEAPDSELFYLLFARHFAAKQLKVSDDVINYLATHVERSFTNALDIVNKLDKLSLEQKRNITIPLVKEITGS